LSKEKDTVTRDKHREQTEEHANIVSMRQLLECGVHFGHQTKRWNPKMKRYIFTSRNGIHVIDLQQSIVLIKKAYHFVSELVKNGGTVLFVGTKKQAQESIQTEAERCSMPYVQHRWLGGTLTNIATIRKSINKLKELTKLIEDGTMDQLSNKEASKKTKKHTRLSYYLNGIKDMIQIPAAVFIIDTKKEQLAIQEARKLNIPIIGIVDTNADPTEVDYPIPANDDAIRAVKLLCSICANAVLDGQKQSQKNSIEQAEREMAQAAAKKEASAAAAKSTTPEKK
jgi:small subunit ribosomal protein S2